MNETRGSDSAVPAVTFPTIDRARRVNLLRSQLQESGDGAWLFTDLDDIRWLTGFGGSNGWVVLRGDELIIGTDGRYGERARAESAGSGATVFAEQLRPRLHERLLEVLRGASSVGLDPAMTSHSEWSALAKELDLLSLASPVKKARRIKDAAELSRIEAAAGAADAALLDVEPMLLGAGDAPITEADVRNELEYRMRLHGADDRSYETIVATGPEHAARPHHDVSRRRIVDGDTVIVDVGALCDGYHSDMTRSYVIGEPTEQQREIYELVEVTHRAGIGALRAGTTARQIDTACREVFDDAGCGDWFLHGTGHGVGLDIHEPPFHSQASDDLIEAGNVVTIEPGLYRVNFGGFRIEDLLVVTEHGSRVLTHTPQRPFPGHSRTTAPNDHSN
jgi:Xaa-Pro aminopeptidase